MPKPRISASDAAVIEADAEVQTVDLYWKCEIGERDRKVRWWPQSRQVRLYDRDYAPTFSASQVPVPFDGLRIWSHNKIKKDRWGGTWAGRMVKWGYETRPNNFQEMTLPSKRALAAAAAAEDAARAAYTPSG
jgi:hypothetical protein